MDFHLDSPLAISPLVSLIVPMGDDPLEGAARLKNAKQQSWHHCQVVGVSNGDADLLPGLVKSGKGNLAAAINAGILASKGEFISVMLPGVLYSDDKITKQIEFINQFELFDCIIYCKHNAFDSKNNQNNNIQPADPMQMFRKIYSGFPLDFSGLLIPRAAFNRIGLLNEKTPDSALRAFCLEASRIMPFVGIDLSLIEVRHIYKMSLNRKEWRNLYARMMPYLMEDQISNSFLLDHFTSLGEAFVARLGEGRAWAAWDICLLMIANLSAVKQKQVGLFLFSRPFLQKSFQRLPAILRRKLRRRTSEIKSGGNVRLDFSGIYRTNGFLGTESLSGAGSTLFQTRIIRRELPKLLRQLQIKSILDIPCGDFNWMQHIDLEDVEYIGSDVVLPLIECNRQKFETDSKRFITLDLIVGPLPTVDLVLCRDCLVHLPFVDGLSAIETIRKSTSKWFLSTTFTRDSPNEELDSKGWRALNLTLAPFNLPEPAVLILEKCTEDGGRSGDKALGLWRVADM